MIDDGLDASSHAVKRTKRTNSSQDQITGSTETGGMQSSATTKKNASLVDSSSDYISCCILLFLCKFLVFSLCPMVYAHSCLYLLYLLL